MRVAADRMVELYKTSPIFQDIVETAINTGVIATGQAIGTDMSAEEIAMSAGIGAGAAMIGRPIGGRIGQSIGGVVDRRAPGVGVALGEGIEDVKRMPGLGPIMSAKMGPYEDLAGAQQYGQLLGRGYGDNIAQYGVGIAMPLMMNGSQQTEEALVAQ